MYSIGFTKKASKGFLFGCALSLMSSAVFADENTLCLKSELKTHPQNVLSCFVNSDSSTPASWKLEKSEYRKEAALTVYTYTLTSQFWPDKTISNSGRDWKHTLVLYVPDHVTSTQSFLYINGGTRFEEKGKSNPKPAKVDFEGLVKATQSVVADLQDIPDQYLSFDDGIARREDGIVAYTWNKYMDDPEKNAYWPAHLPMTKAVVKAMDMIQSEADVRHYQKPTDFVLSGASKRGWTAWLTTIVDNRVNGIIPIVIDILNTKKNLLHIKKSLNAWPLAFHDYEAQGVTKRMDTLEFDKLMSIEDPIAYLSYPKYASRLAVPKYIINASSDDFFVPDSYLQYAKALPGETVLRILPNQRHYIDYSIVNKALIEYYTLFINKLPRPDVRWNASKDNQSINVTTNFEPIKATLWEGYNPKDRDFRIYPAKMEYKQTQITGVCIEQKCVYKLAPITTTTGYTSRFIEFVYDDGSNRLVTTSPAFITPNTYPQPNSQ
ncbi:PhoP/Q-regulated protein PqaA [Moritella sp. JT01]|uniref:PhoPQ-activated protein PqaA family protein n=1 Tax=Moritella sp. JT01 TaxID=756698 RepID=UPI00079B45AD|nr:PhoPQ-activated protein PqaA family protein [Moritella sp. JT01]KXO09144.1 PhoP/Q-regulated protein PqaA [Moritella sp. JT01]